MTNPATIEARHWTTHLALDYGFYGLKRPLTMHSCWIKARFHTCSFCRWAESGSALTMFLLITPWLIQSCTSSRVNIKGFLILDKKDSYDLKKSLIGGMTLSVCPRPFWSIGQILYIYKNEITTMLNYILKVHISEYHITSLSCYHSNVTLLQIGNLNIKINRLVKGGQQWFVNEVT